MTSIFDALKKSRRMPQRSAVSPPVLAPVRPGALPPGGETTLQRYAAAERRAATLGGPGTSAEPIPATPQGAPMRGRAHLPDDVVQQMTALRVNIEAALAESGKRAILFQCSQGGEGTSTVAHQFAATLARESGLRTLLVDANARHPSLEWDGSRHGVVRIEARAAVADAGDDGFDGLPLPEDVRETGVYAPGAFRAVLEACSRSYDWVVIDGPPLLEAPDATPLAGLADGVVLVIRAGRTKRPVLSRSVDLLRKAGARVIGSVLNRRRLEIPGFIYRRI